MHAVIQDLSGKVALITGAAQRIGACFSRTLHQAGASVLIHYRHSAEPAKMLRDELNARRSNSAQIVAADLCLTDTHRRLVGAAIQTWGRLDILVNNASSFYPTPVGTVSNDQWDDLLCSNLKAPFFLAQEACEELQKNKGVIVNIVDIHGQRPLARHPVYCSAKAGLIMLTKSLSKELAPHVRVNAIAPGSILWPQGEASLSDKKKQAVLDEIALQRQGEPDDLAQSLLYLVSEQSSYVTGQIIAVDGGRSL